MHKPNIIISVIILVTLAASAFTIWQLATYKPAPGSTTTSQTTPNGGRTSEGPDGSPQTGAAAPAPSPSQPYSFHVYFSKHPASDDDPSKVFPVNRTAPTLGLAQASVSQLLNGPTASEAKAGYFSTAKLRSGTSTCGGADFTLHIQNNIATLTFCKPFDHLGVVADGQAQSELTATLQQFASVHKVIILSSNGHCEFDLSGLDLCKH